MSKGFVPTKVWEERIKVILKDHLTKDIVDKFLKKEEDKAFKMAARMVRYHSDKFLNFKQILQESMRSCNINFSDGMFAGSPLMFLAPKTNELRIFQNIPLDNMDERSVKFVSSLLKQDTLATFTDKYQKALNDPNMKVGWDTVHRAWGKIKRYNDVTTATALTRFTKLKDYLSPNQIRDVATGIDEMRKPMEIIYPETPEGIIEMYSSGPSSCMSPTSSHAKTWGEMLSVKQHPCVFFLYCPYTRPVYTKFQGKVAVRSILYQDDRGAWHLGRVYSSNDKLKNKFIQTFREQGIDLVGSISEKTPFYRATKFTIPEIHVPGYGVVAPLPYFDNFDPSIEYTYDAKAKEFTITVNKGVVANVNWQSTAGFIRATDIVKNRRCDHCDKLVSPITAKKTQDGKMFCTTVCQVSAGYIGAYRDDGGVVYVRREDCVEDAYEHGRYYTNLNAAKACGAHPYITTLDEEPEDEEMVTVHGHTIIRNGERYQLVGVGADTMISQAVTAGTIMNSGRGGWDFIGPAAASKPVINIKKQKVVEFYDTDKFIVELAA